LAFIFGKPPCRQGIIRQNEDRAHGNQACDSALEDEEPLPAVQASFAGCDFVVVAETVEDTCCYQAGEGSGQD
jgi:hypothetical protein